MEACTALTCNGQLPSQSAAINWLIISNDLLIKKVDTILISPGTLEQMHQNVDGDSSNRRYLIKLWNTLHMLFGQQNIVSSMDDWTKETDVLSLEKLNALT